MRSHTLCQFLYFCGVMRNRTLFASLSLSSHGTIRGGSFLSGLALRDALLACLHRSSAVPVYFV